MKKNLFKSFIVALFFTGPYLVCQAQCTATTVPYYEDFSSVAVNDQLPACWAATGLSNTCLTYPGYAAFLNLSSGPHYFASRALHLNAGVTYSASLWKKSSLQNSSNSLLAILVDASQSFSSQTFISYPAAVTGTMYTPTSNTFTVANSGTYYIGVGAAFLSSNTGEYVYWDDLQVIAPCPYPGNSPTITISASSPTICAGNAPTLTASGADTYTWSDGTQGPTFTISPQVTTYYQVTGTNTLSGCDATATLTLNVNPSPVMIAMGSKPGVCIGEAVTLNSNGAPTVSWSTGANTQSIVVSPSVNTTYTVTGTNQYGCSSSAIVAMIAYPLPTITINPASSTICLGEQAIITAGGALNSYTWSNAAPQSGNSLTINPTSNENFTVTGTNQTGCVSSSAGNLIVSECTGIEEKMSGLSFRLFPNPCKDHLFFSGTTEGQQIAIFDLTGREIFRGEVISSIAIDVSCFAPGLYTVMTGHSVLKFMKE